MARTERAVAVDSALNEPAPPPLQVQAPAAPPFVAEPVSIRRAREILAYLLFALFAASVLLSLLLHVGEASWLQAKEFMQIAVPAELGLLGAAIGFYFGSDPTGP